MLQNLTKPERDQLLYSVYSLELQAQRLIDRYVRGEARAEEQQALDVKTRAIDALLVKLGDGEDAHDA